MQPAQTRTCARVKLLMQAQLCQRQRRRRLLQARASIVLQHHAAAGALPAACLQQRVRGRASSRGQKGATRCTCIPAGTATWHSSACTRQPGTALRVQYGAHNQARAQPHNLNGHTAHAAPKASRSQAYTLPPVALLAPPGLISPSGVFRLPESDKLPLLHRVQTPTAHWVALGPQEAPTAGRNNGQGTIS